jgi:transposase
VLQAGECNLADKIAGLCLTRSEQLAQERAKKLIEAAQRNPFKSTLYKSHLISLEMYIQMLLQYQEYLAKLDDQIDALAGEIEEYKIIQSIPGIGEKIAATIFSEIGEIERFNHPKN